MTKILRILGLESVNKDKLRTIINDEKDMSNSAKQQIYKITDEIRDIVLPTMNVKIADLK